MLEKLEKSLDSTYKPSFLKFPIPDTKGYTIDLHTHEIFSPRGNKMKPFVDSRGRVSTKLMRLDGKQRVYVVKDIAKKIHLSLTKEKQIRTKTGSDIMLQNIDEIMNFPKGIDRYQFCKQRFPKLDQKEIKKFLSYLK